VAETDDRPRACQSALCAIRSFADGAHPSPSTTVDIFLTEKAISSSSRKIGYSRPVTIGWINTHHSIVKRMQISIERRLAMKDLRKIAARSCSGWRTR